VLRSSRILKTFLAKLFNNTFKIFAGARVPVTVARAHDSWYTRVGLAFHVTFVLAVHLYCFVLAILVSAAVKIVRDVSSCVAEIVWGTVVDIADTVVVGIGSAVGAHRDEYERVAYYTVAELIEQHDRDRELLNC
jgi:hypothetical protein